MAGLSQGHGRRRKLRLGQPLVDDLPLPAGAHACMHASCAGRRSPSSMDLQHSQPNLWQAFAKQFGAAADDLDMAVVYDVSHNIAKVHAGPHSIRVLLGKAFGDGLP